MIFFKSFFIHINQFFCFIYRVYWACRADLLSRINYFINYDLFYNVIKSQFLLNKYGRKKCYFSLKGEM